MKSLAFLYPRGKIVTLPNGGFADIPGVFAGGDCASGPATVIKAVAAAKVTAANIDEYLGYHHEITCNVEIPLPNNADHTPCGRVELSEREASERKHDFEGVENCMNKKEIAQESGRCLRCDHFGFGIFKEGVRNYGKFNDRQTACICKRRNYPDGSLPNLSASISHTYATGKV